MQSFFFWSLVVSIKNWIASSFVHSQTAQLNWRSLTTQTKELAALSLFNQGQYWNSSGLINEVIIKTGVTHKDFYIRLTYWQGCSYQLQLFETLINSPYSVNLQTLNAMHNDFTLPLNSGEISEEFLGLDETPRTTCHELSFHKYLSILYCLFYYYYYVVRIWEFCRPLS